MAEETGAQRSVLNTRDMVARALFSHRVISKDLIRAGETKTPFPVPVANLYLLFLSFLSPHQALQFRLDDSSLAIDLTMILTVADTTYCSIPCLPRLMV